MPKTTPEGKGSPPPTRGTQADIDKVTTELGITPAYAGNTEESNKASALKEDHPRLRGEHHRRSGPKSDLVGSPPPTRGTPLPLLLL